MSKKSEKVKKIGKKKWPAAKSRDSAAGHPKVKKIGKKKWPTAILAAGHFIFLGILETGMNKS